MKPAAGEIRPIVFRRIVMEIQLMSALYFLYVFSILHWSTFIIVMANHVSLGEFGILLTKNISTAMHIVFI